MKYYVLTEEQREKLLNTRLVDGLAALKAERKNENTR